MSEEASKYNSINEMMEADPLSLVTSDITAIIEHFRSTRITFVTTTKQTKNVPAAKKLAKGEAMAKELGLDLTEFKI